MILLLIWEKYRLMDKLQQIDSNKVIYDEAEKFLNNLDRNSSISKEYKQFSSYGFGNQSAIVNRMLKSIDGNFKVLPKGNPNFRINGIIERGSSSILFEYCFDNDILNSYRRLLDGIAIDASEKKIDYQFIQPVIIFDEFSNKRSDMWQTLDDVFKVLGIKFKMLSVPELMLIYIFGKNQFHKILEISDYDKVINGAVQKEFLTLLNCSTSLGLHINDIAIFKPKK